MDFIERIAGFSPDHGSGSVEWLWLLAAAVLVALSWRSLFRRR